MKVETIEELKQASNELRAHTLIALHAAGSGHSGGSLSAMDFIAALYLKKLNHDPSNPQLESRDRVFFSKAHVVPALYAALAKSGYVDIKEIMTLRKLGSPFQGHSDMLKCGKYGVEISGGSLGQGLGIAIGSAKAAKLNNQDYRVFCIMGDGEQQEGSVWESAMSASQFKLDNLVAFVDKNDLQIDGWVKDVMNVTSLAKKYESFGWHVIEINGNDMQQILNALNEAETVKGKPTVIIGQTVKGKGVSFMENEAGWHGRAPNREELDKALQELNVPTLTQEKVEEYLNYAKEFGDKTDQATFDKLPKFSRNYWWNTGEKMKVEMEPTRFGFGKCLQKNGGNENLVTIQADISGSIKISDFEANNPERKPRAISVGIAEQNMIEVAGGLAKEGKIPITGTYGVFASGRPWDQIRTTVCYGNLNVKIAGAHGGISVGPDGATHQALEEISLMAILPNMNLSVPSDSIETEKSCNYGFLELKGPFYVRFGREAVPTVTKEDTPFKFGIANIIRYRGETEKFVDAFETKLSTEYKNENEQIAIITCGAMVAESMRAAKILKDEYGVESRIINMHTIKPLDKDAINNAVKDIGLILTVEEHQVGGFGNIIAGEAIRSKFINDKLKLDMVGVEDRFGESGQPWQLTREFGLSAESIAQKAKESIDQTNS